MNGNGKWQWQRQKQLISRNSDFFSPGFWLQSRNVFSGFWLFFCWGRQRVFRVYFLFYLFFIFVIGGRQCQFFSLTWTLPKNCPLPLYDLSLTSVLADLSGEHFPGVGMAVKTVGVQAGPWGSLRGGVLPGCWPFGRAPAWE